MPTPSQKTLILGGGVSGLLAAWYLRRPGREIQVWEASAAVGGWAQTLPWPGPEGESGSVERGPQGLRLARESALQQLVAALELPLQPVAPRGLHWLGRRGRRFPSPGTLPGLFRAPGLGLAGRLRLLGEPFVPAGTDPNELLSAFCARRLGQGFAREWLPALVAGILAAPPERLGLEALPELRRMEACGGLLWGSLRARAGRTRHPVDGTGALAQELAARLGCVSLHHRAQALEPLPGGRWRVHGENLQTDADEVVLALPPSIGAALLSTSAPEASGLLGAIPMLALRVWHSRHAPVPGWERGFNLLLHPPEGQGLLGVVGLARQDPRAAPGLLQLRSFVGGAYPVAPALEAWPGVFAELRRWLPELSDPLQVRVEDCTDAFPLMAPGHGARVAGLLSALPPGIHWVGAARFGPGLPGLAEGIAAWAQAVPGRDRRGP